MSVLIIEDYDPLRKSLAKGLKEAGYAVDATGDGEEGLWFAKTGQYDVIVLDLMLPGMDGLTILKKLRSKGNPVHIIILTAKDTLDDKVKGLDLGADDYLVKPFEFKELLARVRALVRRTHDEKSPVIKIGNLKIDTGNRTAHRGKRPVELTAREYAILEYLALRAGQVVTRDDICKHVYDWTEETNSNIIDVYIGYIRKKLEEDGGSRLIHTRRGMGYILEEK
ncbi:MAG: response regulator transcription factor [Planctomycetota bacterium]|jgi:DNA-binding response OmpR family regulator